MTAFIGCLIHTGCLYQNVLSLDILFHPADGNPLLRATFSRHRFNHLMNTIRFDDKETRTAPRARDRFALFRDTWESFQMNLKKYYHAGESVPVDEQRMPFGGSGRCSFEDVLSFNVCPVSRTNRE